MFNQYLKNAKEQVKMEIQKEEVLKNKGKNTKNDKFQFMNVALNQLNTDRNAKHQQVKSAQILPFNQDEKMLEKKSGFMSLHAPLRKK